MSLNNLNEVQWNTHAEIDAKTAPTGLKILFGAIFVIFIIGIIAIFYLSSSGEADMITILTIGGILLGSVFILISILSLWIMKLDNNKDSIGQIVSRIFIIIGIIFYIITICINIGNPETLLKIGLPILIIAIFSSLGMGLLIYGNRRRKKEKGNCTFMVNASCVGFTQEDPAPAIWEFTYQSFIYRAIQLNIISKEYISIGKQTKIYINPQNPNEIYCPICNSYDFFRIFGIIFILTSILCGGIILIVLQFIL